MKLETINNQFSISSQICCEDVEQLSKEGVQTLICIRPDNEAHDQTSFSET